MIFQQELDTLYHTIFQDRNLPDIIMKQIFCFLIIASGIHFNPLFAQKLPEEVPDYRSNRDNFSKVREKDVRADAATFTIAGITEMIGKEPLPKIPPKDFHVSQVEFENEDIYVKIHTRPFYKDSVKLMMYDDKYLLKINNKPFYGNYGSVPSRVISDITVVYKGDTIAIPPVAYQDIYDPVFSYRDKDGKQRSLNGVLFSRDGSRIYIYLHSRGQRSVYEVTWVIQNGQYLRRILDYDLNK